MHSVAGRPEVAAGFRTALAATADGRGLVLVVLGAPGLGRSTALADARAIAADRGITVWSAAGHVAERTDAGAVLDDLLATGGRSDDPPSRRLLAAVRAHGQPLLITVDDADAADDTSFAAIAHLARRIASLPVVLVVATAAAEPDDRIGALADDVAAHVLRLGPLDRATAERHVRRIAGPDADPAFVRACLDDGDGHPLLLSALAAARSPSADPSGPAVDPSGPTVAASGPAVAPPDEIVRFVSRHLRAAGPEARALAAASAILAATGSPPAAAPAVAGLDAAATLIATARLERLGLLAPDGPLRLSPPTVARAVDAHLSPEQARTMHARAAEVVRRFGASELAVALHLRQARTAVDADQAQTLRTAAAAALDAGTAPTAVRLLQHADTADIGVDERATVRALLVRAAVAAGDLPLARTVVDAELAACGPEESHRRAVARASQALLALHAGDLAAAEDAARDALSVLSPVTDGPAVASASGALVATLVVRGDRDQAARAAGASFDADATDPPVALPRVVAFALLLIAEDRPQDAVDALDTLPVHGADPLAVDSGVLLASALLAAGRSAAATQRAHDALQRIVAERRGPLARGTALRTLGLCLPGPPGLRRLDEAVALLRPTPAGLELTRALLDLGAALRRNRRRADARPFLREALERAEDAGARPLADRARDELAATGRRVRRGERLERDQLTPSERRVAGLAASGQTNRQIAQTLFVTTKTVEMHLSSCYRKLGIAARHELPSDLAAPAADES